MHQQINCKRNSKKFKAIAVSFATLSKNFNTMVVNLGASNEGKKQPSRDEKMGANAKNLILAKNPKKEKE